MVVSAIMCGVVTYNPKIERLKQNLEAIYPQVSLVTVVDNGSNNIDAIDGLCEKYPKILIIKNKKNEGIACALNQLMEVAEVRNYEWVLTLDQDSVAPFNLVEQLYTNTHTSDQVGVVCPAIYDINQDRILPSKYKNPKNNELRSCITSGALTSISVWNLVGKYDEQLFIDSVDQDFCKRVVLAGYKIIRTDKTILRHEIGKATHKKFLFVDFYIQNHNAMRKYYMARNWIYVYFKYSQHFQPVLLAELVFRLIRRIFVITFFEQQKIEKLSATFRGIHDGIVMGRKVHKM